MCHSPEFGDCMVRPGGQEKPSVGEGKCQRESRRLEVGPEHGAGPPRQPVGHPKVKARGGRLPSAFSKPHSLWLCVGNVLEQGTPRGDGGGGVVQ